MKNGIYKDLSIEDYHENSTHISASELKKAKKSLKLFKWHIDGKLEDERKPHFDFGNAFESALCEGMENLDKYVQFYDVENRPEKDKGITSKKNQVWKKEFHESEKLVINKVGKESLETIDYMVDSCMSDPTIKMLLEKRDYQTSIFWKDKETGLNLKTRPDILNSHKSIVVDIKTTLDGSSQKFGRDASNFDYFLQACQQIDGVLSSGLMPAVDNYFYLVVEKVPPYNATLYELDNEDLVWLMAAYGWLKNKVAKAMESGEFKGYNYESTNKYGIMTIDIPLYYKNTY